MTPSKNTARRNAVRAIAVTAVAGLATTIAVTAGGGPAGASEVYAQSVGRFLDGAAGGRPIQALVDLHDARATAPGTTTQQNPLEATLLGQAEIPLGHKLQQPGGGVFQLGAAQQVAVARDNGFSYGASGAIRNSGGASLGGDNHAYPADATITLSSDAFGSVPVPGLPDIPGVPTPPDLPKPGNAPALGGATAQIGAVAALASTKVGGEFRTPRYEIAGLTLSLESPALAQLVQTLQGGSQQFGALVDQLQQALSQLPTPLSPKHCALTSASVPSQLSLDNGAVVLDATNASVTVDVAALLRQLGFDLNALPPNTDLMAFVANNLGRILSRGLEHVVNGVVHPLQRLGQNCFAALPGPAQKLVQQLSDGQKQLEGAINQIADTLSGAGAPGLKQLTDGLAQAADIGVNVQQGAYPLSSERSPRFAYDSKLAATPDQATGAISGQGVVRAIELDLGGSGASIALGNAAAGPSSPAPAPAVHHHSAAPTTTTAPSAIPTGVPAGAAGGGAGGGTPLLPIAVLLIGLSVAGGSALAYQLRGKFSR